MTTSGSVLTILILAMLFCAINAKPSPVSHRHYPGPLLSFLTQKRRDVASMCRAHSHNDYHQAYPLSSALKHGLKSVEVDVFPRHGGLWVAHTVFGLNPERTIESLYLRPLLQIFQRSSVSSAFPLPVFPLTVPVSTRSGWTRRSQYPELLRASPRGGSDSRPHASLSPRRPSHVNTLNLIVDFKGDADVSATLLQKALKPLLPFLSKVDRYGVFHPGRLTVLISGNRPNVSSLQASNGERFLFLDGRVKDIHGQSDTQLVPLVSLPWRKIRLARTLGRGEVYMRRMAAKAHAQGKLVRIWGCPNCPRTWQQMVTSNIDFLSIDDHAKFASFVATK